MRSVEAYDFSIFERRNAEKSAAKEKEQDSAPDNIIELPKEKAKKAVKERLHAHPVRVAVLCIGIVLLVAVTGAFVYGQVQLSMLAVQISDMDTSLNEQRSLYTQLQMKSDAQESLATVEEIAQNKLGMSRIDSSQMESVEMNASDKAQVVQKSGDCALSRLWEQICALLS
ncbi:MULTISPECIES: hypothetical protein [Caproicibacterium]|jgi:cell division protein FtsL|uniref:Cell division protein FtsL n=1 Tax=Caproicibacterium lactatifermentans TaxID=2666138 RepID=A0A859DP71_9FIRM|nr:hypothetical protein [Caproicibacterium lactatifermentans]ARP50700.1 hypothetical protein B6259_07325 [Ruminococcaceae bacterium CPB6]MDD4807451.1 hypothetical protein [Oscillospiraceae bacterium]QKN23570.1 hypothetical protein GJQ69_03150 [Caproicibacterium lactatifermentans]QKO29754.1 hypothetical protein GKP14_01215 [Caproicibacterium lactatifermentans]